MASSGRANGCQGNRVNRLAPGTRCALEHGGAAPVLVDRGVDLDPVVRALAKGGFYHAGQVCVSVQRVYAHRDIALTLARALAEAARRLEVDDPALAETEVGPLIRPAEVERVDQWVREAGGRGAYGWLDELFALVEARGPESAPDFITLDGADGGTGAAPMSLIDDMGLPLRVSLPLLVDKLSEYGLRERIRVIASGKLVTPADVAWTLCLGADFVASARGFMFALGCIQALQCNKNTCPTGITTHNPKLQKGLHPPTKAERVAVYASNIVREVGVIAHACGVRSPRELRRFHAHVVKPDGLTIGLDTLYPEVPRRPSGVVAASVPAPAAASAAAPRNGGRPRLNA